MKKICATLVLTLLAGVVFAESTLDGYIRSGLSGNLALRQHRFTLEKSLEALKEAKRMYSPTVAVQARYSRAGGGRMIEFPIGDLMNPVYSSLNDLYRLQGIPSDYPTNLANESFPFFRRQEQETKIRIVQPLLQPAIHHNIRIKSRMSDMERAGIDVYTRELIAEIQTAYFNYSKTRRVFELLEQTKTLLEENLRISRELVRIGKATEDTVFRAEAEMAGLEQKQAEALKNESMAQSYFNFLLNRDLNTSITIETSPPPPSLTPENIEDAVKKALTKRNEFRQMEAALSLTGQQEKLAGSAYLPTVSAVVDYGIQGETYSLGKDDDYWMASLVFEWNVFDGGRNRSIKNQAALEKKRLAVQKAELAQQIRLQVVNASSALQAARKALEAAKSREKSAEESFRIVQKKYKHGTAPQIEYLDAQTTLTEASVSRILAEHEVHINAAEFDRVTAGVDVTRFTREETAQ